MKQVKRSQLRADEYAVDRYIEHGSVTCVSAFLGVEAVIRLAVLLCKARHPAARDGVRERRLGRPRRGRAARAGGKETVPECGGRSMAVEHSDTGFKTLAEAAPHVAKLNGVRRSECRVS